MVLFMVTALAVYCLLNSYLYLKGYRCVETLREHRLAYTLVFIAAAAVFPLAKAGEAWRSSAVTDVLNVAGGLWLAFMLYGILLFLVSDIIMAALKLAGAGAGPVSAYRKWAFVAVTGASFMLIAAGVINALVPVVKRYGIAIDKPAAAESLRIAAVSDIHLGSIIRERSLRRLSSMLAAEKPDLILLLGDIVDGQIAPVLRGDLLRHFTPPECRYGVFAVAGNHEYIGGGMQTIPYIESRGIRILKDEVVALSCGIQLIGRIDRDAGMFYGRPRAALKKLMAQADTSMPVIVLDHQPSSIDEAAGNRVDLQLSGHTHHGQMWPLNGITRMIYRVSRGYLKEGAFNVIVSSGYGLWGAPVRLGSRPEVLIVNVSFTTRQ
jgi:predicted MPP superfamily phosphohydrolase